MDQLASLVAVCIFLRNVVFKHFPSTHFALIGIGSVLHAADGFSFHVLAFFHQFFHAFRIVIASA